MKWGLSFAMAVGLAVALLTGPAAALTMGVIDDATLATLTGPEVAGALTSTFDFVPPTPGGDGSVVSQVYLGAGAAAGNYLYLYQIDHFMLSSIDKVSGISFEFGSVPVDVPGIGQSFYVTDGDLAPLVTDHVGTTATLFWLPGILPGQTSHTVGLVSPNAPSTVTATVLDSGVVFAQASVYSNGAVVPEPTGALLFGVGFVTVAGFGVRRSRA